MWHICLIESLKPPWTITYYSGGGTINKMLSYDLTAYTKTHFSSSIWLTSKTPWITRRGKSTSLKWWISGELKHWFSGLNPHRVRRTAEKMVAFSLTWINKQINERVNAFINDYTCEWVNEWMNSSMNRQIDK